ncbi:MAG: primosomal protein N' [Fimbriimonadaceae bacterium]|nr:primosomal protein N' [Fimbriimonadaceae bacterium]
MSTTTSATLLVADVVISAKDAGATASYTYAAPPEARRGEAWIVPLGGRRAIGYILGVRSASPEELGFDPARLRPLTEPIRGLDLPEALMDLIEETARQTLSPLPSALSAAAPPGIRERLAVTWRPGSAVTGPLPGRQAEALKLLQERGILYEGAGSSIADPMKRALRTLARKGLAERGLELRRWSDRRSGEQMVALNPDPSVVERFLAGPGRKRPAQAVTVMRLQGLGTSALPTREIRALAGVSDVTVQALLDAGVLVAGGEDASSMLPAPKPNPDQDAAIEAVTKAVCERRPEKFLLFGVTGSGKTEVYMRCMAEALKMGRGVLYLVPEIALTAQTLTRLRARFGDRVAMLHSNLSARERLESWTAIRQMRRSVVLGARSALFAPLEDIGLIVIDEEHEGSFKQESPPRYSTGPLAESHGRRHGCPVVFGSATPSIETFHRAKTGELAMLRLPSRAAAATLPTVETLDLAELFRARKPALVSERLQAEIASTLERREQAILFLNRRAYAPVLKCRECGHCWECPRCTVALAYHRQAGQLRCHHCTHSERAPANCPECESQRVAGFGVGVQRLEECLTELFPQARIARLDRDVARRSGALEEVLASFRAGATDILVGTQLVAKGLDFPNVTLVGAVAADVSLHVPDFRASERTFQLLSQVGGRAGRAKRPGRVLIQTFQPNHVAIVCARAHDYEGFFEAEIQERREAGYPPFRRLVNVVVSGNERTEVVAASASVAEALRRAVPRGEVLGPTDCPLARLDGQWRRHALLKLEPGADFAPIATVLESLRLSTVRIVADVDPVSLV